MSSKLSKSQLEERDWHEWQKSSNLKKCSIIGFALLIIVVWLLSVVALVLTLIMIFLDFPC